VRNFTNSDVPPEDWLNAMIISEFESNQNEQLHVPTRDDGKDYTVDALYPDQKEIVTVVLNTLHEFLNCEDLSTFKPLRMTVRGQGGSGKSVVINTIVAVMRRMFGINDVVRVVAPTGVAAFNVNGETIHRMLNMGIAKYDYKADSLTPSARLRLIEKFKMLLAVIIDERSMLGSRILGTAEQMVSETIHGGGHLRNESWGGLPIVVLVGDDYQLPGFGEGAFSALYSRNSSKMTNKGRSALLKCTEVVMELKSSKRVKEDKVKDKELLDRLRVAEEIKEEDVQKLLSLRLDTIQNKHGADVVQSIKSDAMHLFYLNEKRIRHNLHMLAGQCSPSNPVAILKAHSTGTKNNGKGVKSHFESDIPNSSLICQDAKVAIDCLNFNPLWGLHNGACGTVQEIIFAPGDNPNSGDLPKYVVVHFPLYCGPPWDKDNPKLVPVPLVTFDCKNKSRCCRRVFMPLTLAYARTIHKFQGLTAGPVDEGKIPNMHNVIVCDPDEKHFEGTAIGLLYTAVSRATTLSDDDGLNSAIYFDGNCFKANRIRNLIIKENGGGEFEGAKK